MGGERRRQAQEGRAARRPREECGGEGGDGGAGEASGSYRTSSEAITDVSRGHQRPSPEAIRYLDARE